MGRPKKDTRQILIDTAKTMLWSVGYGAVSVDDLCRAAGIQKGSFYHYFASKQGLALTALEEHFSKTVEPALTRAFAANIPFEQQIDALADFLIEQKKQEKEEHGYVCGCPLGAIGSETAGQQELKPISNKVEEMFSKCCMIIAQSFEIAIKQGTMPLSDPLQKSMEVHDFISGLMMMARVHNSTDGLERNLKPGLYHILGLKPEENTLTHKI